MRSDSLAPLLEGLYERVAQQLGVEVSQVVAAALGNAPSKTIEAALRRELQAITNRANIQIA